RWRTRRRRRRHSEHLGALAAHSGAVLRSAGHASRYLESWRRRWTRWRRRARWPRRRQRAPDRPGHGQAHRQRSELHADVRDQAGSASSIARTGVHEKRGGRVCGRPVVVPGWSISYATLCERSPLISAFFVMVMVMTVVAIVIDLES